MVDENHSRLDRFVDGWGDLFTVIFTPQALLPLTVVTIPLFVMLSIFSFDAGADIVLEVLAALSALHTGIAAKAARGVGCDISGQERLVEKGKLFTPTLERLSDLSADENVSKSELNRHIETISLITDPPTKPKR